MVSSPSCTFCLSSVSSLLRLSNSLSTFLCSKCSFTSAWSFAWQAH